MALIQVGCDEDKADKAAKDCGSNKLLLDGNKELMREILALRRVNTRRALIVMTLLIILITLQVGWMAWKILT